MSQRFRAEQNPTRRTGTNRAQSATSPYRAVHSHRHDGSCTSGQAQEPSYPAPRLRTYAAPPQPEHHHVRRRKPRKSGRALRTGALILAVLLLGSATLPKLKGMLGGIFAGSAMWSGSTARSTPASEWRQGTVPNLYQIDPQWADEPYAGADIETSGCGPTCLSMVYVALTGRTDFGPVEMARFSEQNGFVADGLTEWALMTDGAALLGITGSELAADADAVRGALEAGRPVICSVRPGDFTTTGHFIVLAGIDENGQVIVHDPNSAERSSHPWDLDRVLGQCANLWEFS